MESLADCPDILTIASSPYELIARADGRFRSGSLLRIDFVGGSTGYADLHPWPELGDLALHKQLDLLTNGLTSPLSQRSLFFCRLDAHCRGFNQSCFDALTIPPSHASMPYGITSQDLRKLVEAGVTTVKIKERTLSADQASEFAESGLKVRVDFNLTHSFESLSDQLTSWGDLTWIDWIEDPFPANSAQWNDLRTRFGVRLALDFADPTDFDAYDVRIIKPARDETPINIAPNQSLCFTSYLDHPLGQLTAAWQAAQAVNSGLAVEVCGLTTHTVYEPNAFSEQFRVQAGRLIPPGGPGFGFQTELEALPWERIR